MRHSSVPRLAHIIDQHADALDAMLLRRRRIVVAGHVTLEQLGRTDEFVDAHLDGLRIAGHDGVVAVERVVLAEDVRVQVLAALCDAQAGHPALGDAVALGVAQEDGQLRVADGLAWIDAGSVEPIVERLVTAHGEWGLGAVLAVGNRSPIGLAGRCAAALASSSRALNLAGLRAAALAGLTDFADAASSVIAGAGDDRAARTTLGCLGLMIPASRPDPDTVDWDAPWHDPARLGAELTARSQPLDSMHALLSAWSRIPLFSRRLLRIIGAVGDPHYAPWLVGRMFDPKSARLAGESFSMITGADLAWLDLDRKPPENFASGPNDDPDDPDVGMDDDDGLPWPDPEKVGAWWKANGHRFPAGRRFFMGQPPSMAHCLEVLKTGYQRQRMAAAIWRCILQPGTPLFPTDAPAWRQKRWLAGMSA